MRIQKDDIDVKMEVPGAVLRQQMDFGDASGYDKISGEYFSFSAGIDSTDLFKGLEGDLCQCPHWGFVVRGKMTTTDAKGVEETVRTNDLFYWPEGHNIRVEEDTELVLFSPQHKHKEVIDHMIRKVSA